MIHARRPMAFPTRSTHHHPAPKAWYRSHGPHLLVISSSIGSGVFALSTDISAAAAPGAAIIAWAITGVGFIALANTFGRLSLERPDLDGIVAYAKEGFGPFLGFVSGWVTGSPSGLATLPLASCLPQPSDISSHRFPKGSPWAPLSLSRWSTGSSSCW